MNFWRLTIFLDFSAFFLVFQKLNKRRKKGKNMVRDPHKADVVVLPSGSVTYRFRASLNHKNVGQTKFIKTELTEIRYKIK